jgi:CheY-like chemotaxis protein
MPTIPRILIIDDNQLDAQLLREAFGEYGFDPAVVYAPLGAVGMEVLRHLDPAQAPLLVILDLNMPAVSGQEVLESIRADARFRDVPVLVLTSSSFALDRERCEALGVVGFVQKPSTFADYRSVVERIKELMGAEAVAVPLMGDEG